MTETGVSGRLLIVDGDPLNRKFLIDTFQANGFATASAVNAEQAYSECSQMAPDAILIEPFGAEFGIDIDRELARFIRETTNLYDIPVIAVTAGAMDGDERRAVGAGCTEYVTKPVRIDEILKRVRSSLNSGRP